MFCLTFSRWHFMERQTDTLELETSGYVKRTKRDKASSSCVLVPKDDWTRQEHGTQEDRR